MKSETTIFRETPAPLRIRVLILPGSSVLSVAAILDPMRAANRLADRPDFEWAILTPGGAPVELTCGIELPSGGTPGDLREGDTLIVIAGFGHEKHAGGALIRALRRAGPGLRAVGGVESGSWVMARAGLLDGHRATTHWEDLEDFALAFHRVQVVQDRFVISGRYFTAGGASPALDMMLHLIRSRYGKTLAMRVASAFIYDEVHASSDRQPQVSLGRLEGTEPRVAAAIRMMEQSLQRPSPVRDIAARVSLSPRRLENLFRRELGVGPGEYFRQLRLQEARRLVTDTRHDLQTVALRTGFGSQSAFSHAFRRHYGQSASAMRRAHAR